MSPRKNRTTVRELQQQLAALRAEVAALKGSRVVEETRMSLPKRAHRPTPAPATAVAPAVVREPDEPLAARIEALLRERVMTYGELIDELSADEKLVSTAFAAMRRDGKVCNVGDETRAQWTWVCGEKITPKELYALVQRLLRVRPLTFEELMLATRINPNRLSNALTVAKRTGLVVNLGTRAKAVWYLPAVKPKR